MYAWQPTEIIEEFEILKKKCPAISGFVSYFSAINAVIYKAE